MVSPIVHVTCPKCAANVEGLHPGAKVVRGYCRTELYMPAPTADNPRPLVVMLDAGQVVQQLGPMLDQAARSLGALQTGLPGTAPPPPVPVPRHCSNVGLIVGLAIVGVLLLMMMGSGAVFWMRARDARPAVAP
jgi:hypothetical protein